LVHEERLLNIGLNKKHWARAQGFWKEPEEFGLIIMARTAGTTAAAAAVTRASGYRMPAALRDKDRQLADRVGAFAVEADGRRIRVLHRFQRIKMRSAILTFIFVNWHPSPSLTNMVLFYTAYIPNARGKRAVLSWDQIDW
jgi:hypothetical protein